jgi:hypothetical protein
MATDKEWIEERFEHKRGKDEKMSSLSQKNAKTKALEKVKKFLKKK